MHGDNVGCGPRSRRLRRSILIRTRPRTASPARDALDLLERLGERGRGRRDWLQCPEYDILWDEPWFRELLARLA
jgi:hypothetical protein